MSSGKSPVKSSRSGSFGDSHSKQSSSPKEPAKAARRLLSSSTERTDESTPLKKATPGKLQQKQQPPRSRTKSESSDKAASEEGEGQKKSKAELRAERRAIQVSTASGNCFKSPLILIQEAQRALKAQKQTDQKGRPSNDSMYFRI